MELSNQYDLAKISIILGSLASGQNWVTHAYEQSKAFDIQEVQCAFFQGEERLFIAANPREHTGVLNMLNRCGVTNLSSLMQLLYKAHKIFSAPSVTLHSLGMAYFYSAQDRDGYSAVHTVNASFNPAPLTAEQTTKIKKIVDIETKLPKDIEAPHAWLYKKLAGKSIDPKKLNTTTGSLHLVTSLASIGTQTVNVIENNEENVHAELALLKFFTKGMVEGHFSKSKIFLGGKKAACENCQKWIDHYKKILVNGASLHTPEDARPSTTATDSTCPSEFIPALVAPEGCKVDTANPRFNLLFSGSRVDAVTWPAPVVAVPVAVGA